MRVPPGAALALVGLDARYERHRVRHRAPARQRHRLRRRHRPADLDRADRRREPGSGRLLCNTPVGIDPSEILVTQNGGRGYVSVRGENKVKELDLGGDCPVLTGREAFVGTQPDTLQLTPDGRTLVVALPGTPAQISLLDVCSFTVRFVPIPGHTTTGHHWLSANGRFSFVAVENPAASPSSTTRPAPSSPTARTRARPAATGRTASSTPHA